MATPQRFRSAFNGFNREDVVNYIDYLNNRYSSQLEHMSNQLKEAKNSVSPDTVAELQAQLDAALQRCADLEAQLNARVAAATSKELEAYRRAENAERVATARAQKIVDTAQAAIADAAAIAESATGTFTEIAQRTIAQMQEYQASVTATVEGFQAAAAAMQSAAADEE